MVITNQIVIRRYDEQDVKKIVDIAEVLPEWFTDNGIKKMQIDLHYHHGFVALKGPEVVGFLSFFVTEGVGHIGWLGISPELHRHGIGRELVEQLASELKGDGITEIHVSTLGDSVDYWPYEGTRAFYSAMGFEDFRRIEQDDAECPEKLIMVLYI